MSDSLETGDLVYCKWIGAMTHWGVYMGGNMVVHLTVSVEGGFKCTFQYKEKGIVDSVDLDDQRYQWRKNNDKDKDYRASPVHKIIERAISAVEEGKSKYNFIFHNCEHFASFCRYGVELSYQITEFQGRLIRALLEIEELWTTEEQSGEPSSSAKGNLPEQRRKLIITTVIIAQVVLALGPYGRQLYFCLDVLKISLTKELGPEWIVDCASAYKNFLKTSPSLHIRGIGAMLGLFLAVTTTEPCIKWSIEAADFAAFFAHFLPQKSHIEPLMSGVNSMLTSLDGKEGFNMHLSIAATVLGLYPPTKAIGAAVDVIRTIKYERRGNGHKDWAFCLARCVVKNIGVVPYCELKLIGFLLGW